MPNEKTLANSTASRSRQGHAVNVPWVLPLGTAGSHRHTIGQEGGFQGHGERETCVSHSRPGPPAPSAGLAPRPQVYVCPTSRTDPWAATSNLTGDRGARGCESKATTGSSLAGFALYLQGGWRAAGHQAVDAAKSATSGTPTTSCSKPVTCPSSPGVTHLGQGILCKGHTAVSRLSRFFKELPLQASALSHNPPPGPTPSISRPHSTAPQPLRGP